jgi:hypothetical protein
MLNILQSFRQKRFWVLLPARRNAGNLMLVLGTGPYAKLFLRRMDCGRFTAKDEHRTSNVQRRTSNNDVAPLRNLISFVFKNPMSNLE